MNGNSIHLTPFAAIVAVGLALPVGLLAQQSEDGRWSPWSGCWEGTDAMAALLCVQPTQGGVNLISIDGDSRSVETIVANGMPQPIESESCSGTRTAEFSGDGERVYLREEVTCSGVSATLTGMLAMISPTEWVDIRGSQDRPDALSRTFRRASDGRAQEAGYAGLQSQDALAVRMMQWRASEPSDFDDLIEVYTRLGEGGTRAWVAEQIDPFPVNANAIASLADAGVPEGIIDIVVAHAFPDRFVLDEGSVSERESAPSANGYSNRVYPYNIGLYSGYYGYRSGFGYGYGYGYGYPYRDRIIIVRRTTPPPTGGNPNARRPVMPRPGVGYTGGRQPSASSGGSSASGSASAGTRSSTGSASGGRSTGRTAKPRTGGGGPF